VDSAQIPLLRRALDPGASGLIGFSELVHFDIWMNAQHPPLEVAFKLAHRDTGEGVFLS
jgi:hypothetical protein